MKIQCVFLYSRQWCKMNINVSYRFRSHSSFCIILRTFFFIDKIGIFACFLILVMSQKVVGWKWNPLTAMFVSPSPKRQNALEEPKIMLLDTNCFSISVITSDKKKDNGKFLAWLLRWTKLCSWCKHKKSVSNFHTFLALKTFFSFYKKCINQLHEEETFASIAFLEALALITVWTLICILLRFFVLCTYMYKCVQLPPTKSVIVLIFVITFSSCINPIHFLYLTTGSCQE